MLLFRQVRGGLMARVFGCTVSDQLARTVVAALNANGTPGARDAARVISNEVTPRGAPGRLSPAARDAILSVLARNPPSGLSELHGALVRVAKRAFRWALPAAPAGRA